MTKKNPASKLRPVDTLARMDRGAIVYTLDYIVCCACYGSSGSAPGLAPAYVILLVHIPLNEFFYSFLISTVLSALPYLSLLLSIYLRDYSPTLAHSLFSQALNFSIVYIL
jgi:hypothetical protein